MKTINRIVALIMLLVFTISTSGILIQKHTCSKNGTTNVAIAPDIYEHPVSCCEYNGHCEEHEHESFHQDPCCYDVFIYAKISDDYVTSSIISEVVKHVFDIPVFQFVVASISKFDSLNTGDYIPPPKKFFGKTLLHFLHNIKIALPYSL